MISIFSEAFYATALNNALFQHYTLRILNLTGIRNPLKKDKKASRAF